MRGGRFTAIKKEGWQLRKGFLDDSLGAGCAGTTTFRKQKLRAQETCHQIETAWADLDEGVLHFAINTVYPPRAKKALQANSSSLEQWGNPLPCRKQRFPILFRCPAPAIIRHFPVQTVYRRD